MTAEDIFPTDSYDEPAYMSELNKMSTYFTILEVSYIIYIYNESIIRVTEMVQFKVKEWEKVQLEFPSSHPPVPINYYEPKKKVLGCSGVVINLDGIVGGICLTDFLEKSSRGRRNIVWRIQIIRKIPHTSVIYLWWWMNPKPVDIDIEILPSTPKPKDSSDLQYYSNSSWVGIGHE